jgi:hypothetical protein
LFALLPLAVSALALLLFPLTLAFFHLLPPSLLASGGARIASCSRAVPDAVAKTVWKTGGYLEAFIVDDLNFDQGAFVSSKFCATVRVQDPRAAVQRRVHALGKSLNSAALCVHATLDVVETPP